MCSKCLMDHLKLDNFTENERDTLTILRGQLAEVRKVKKARRKHEEASADPRAAAAAGNITGARTRAPAGTARSTSSCMKARPRSIAQGVIGMARGRGFHRRRSFDGGAGPSFFESLAGPPRRHAKRHRYPQYRRSRRPQRQACWSLTRRRVSFQSVVEFTLGFLVDLSRGMSRATARLPGRPQARDQGRTAAWRRHRRHHRLRPHLARAGAGAGQLRHDRAGVRSLCPDRRPALREAADGRAAGARPTM